MDEKIETVLEKFSLEELEKIIMMCNESIAKIDKGDSNG